MSVEDALNEIMALVAARNKAPQLLTVKEAAKYLAVSERTIRRCMRSGGDDSPGPGASIPGVVG